MSDDDRRIYDLVARRFLAVFHPDAEFENTRVETTVAEHVFRTRGKVLLVPGWRGVYGELSEGDGAATTTRAATSSCPRLEQGEAVDTTRGRGRSRRRPSRRGATRDASLLGAMETAGKLVDDEELREAMKDSGIGTPATRAAIIERLIDVGYVERDGRALVPTEKGMNVIRLLGDHPLTSPGADRRLGAAPGRDRGRARRRARSSWSDIAEVRRRDGRRARHDAQGRADPAREPRPVPGLRPRHHREPQGLLVLVARGPGLRLRDLEVKAGKQLPAGRRARAHRDRAHRASRSPASRAAAARSFRARLALEQNEEGRWRVEFDEPWAKEGAKPPEADEAAETADAAAAAGADEGAAAA